MDEIIKLFSKGFVRHLLKENGVFSLIKREERENNDLIISKNARKVVRADNRYFLEKKGS